MPNEDIAATRAVPLGYDFDLSPFTQSECSTVRTHWPCRGVEVSSLTLFFQCYPFVSIQREHHAASTAPDPSTEPGHGDALAACTACCGTGAGRALYRRTTGAGVVLVFGLRETFL